MPIIHDDHQKDGYIYNSDRNIQLFMGPNGISPGEVCWNSAYQMYWSGPIYLSWFGERLWGSANYNVIPAAASPIVIPVDCVAYVMVDPDTDGQTLTPIIVGGASLPHGDNVIVIASHKDIGLTPNNPLILRNNASIPINTCWSQTMGLETGMWAGDFNAMVWNANHNLHSTDVDIVIQDANTPRQQIFPEKIEMIDIDNVRVTFGQTVAGRLLIHIAGKVMTVPAAPSTYFTGLLDCPPSYATHAGEACIVNPGETGLIFSTLAASFIDLTDVPATYAGSANKIVVVNPATTGLIFVDKTFIAATDTPASYPAGSGSSLHQYPVINGTDNGLIFGYGHAYYA